MAGLGALRVWCAGAVSGVGSWRVSRVTGFPLIDAALIVAAAAVPVCFAVLLVVRVFLEDWG